MGKKKSKAPEYPTVTYDTGLFGTSTTNQFGTSFTPTEFQRQLIGTTEANAIPYLNNYLNPDYESADYKRGDEYYTNKMNTQLQNNYINPALSRNLLRGSTAQDVMRGFANDLAASEYERQQDYKDQQLQNYMAAMLPYSTVYDMSKGTTGLSANLANSLATYNMNKYNVDNAKKSSGIGAALGALGNIAGQAAGNYFSNK